METGENPSDEKLMVGSILWEYLNPLVLTDSYLMEEQLV